MKLAITLGLAAMLSAPMALAEGCSKYGHSAMLSAEAGPAQSAPAVADTLVAQLDCAGLTGDALAECEAAKPASN